MSLLAGTVPRWLGVYGAEGDAGRILFEVLPGPLVNASVSPARDAGRGNGVRTERRGEVKRLHAGSASR